ncbi:MAG TPA: CvpA family protein [Pseudonocardia sp.]|jgi:hypothetical protein|nr:CvpA family protein [Pseudonocardia sp.]
MPTDLTLLDLLLAAVVLLAAVAGFRRGGDGAERTGRLVGLLLGCAIALPLAAWLAPAGSGPVSTGLLRLGGLVLGLALGAWAGGAVGRLASRGLWRGRLGLLDRLLGALAAAGTGVLVVWALATAVPMLVSPAALAPVTTVLEPLGGSSTLVRAVDGALPLPARTLDEAVSVAAGH